MGDLYEDPSVSEQDMKSPLQRAVDMVQGKDLRTEEDHRPNTKLSDGKRQDIEQYTGVSNPELQDKIFRLVVEDGRRACHEVMDQMTERLKQAVMIERSRLASYVEEQLLALEAKSIVNVPTSFLRNLAKEVKLAKHHRSRSKDQYVFLPMLEVPSTEKPVENRLVIDDS